MRNLLCLFFLFLTFSAFSQNNNQGNVEKKETSRATLSLSKDRDLINKKLREIKREEGLDLNNYVGEESEKLNSFTTSKLLEKYQNQISKEAAIRTFASNVASFFGTWFGGAFFLLSLCTNYYNNVVKGRTSLNWGKLIRDIALYAVLVCYVPIMGSLNWVANGLPWIIQNISQKSQVDNTFVQFTILVHKPEFGLMKSEINNVLTVAKQQENGTNADKNKATLLAMLHKVSENETYSSTENDSSGFFSISQTLKKVQNQLLNLPNDVIIGILIILASVAKFVIFVLIFAMDKVLFVLGPISILVSYIGFSKDKWITWLSRWLTVKCTLATLVVIDGVLLMMQNTDVLEGSYGHVSASPELTLGFCIIAIAMYIMSFWLTSTYIGSADAGKFLTTAAAAVTSAAGMMTKTFASMGAGGGGSGNSTSNLGGLTQSATNLGNSALKDNPENINR